MCTLVTTIMRDHVKLKCLKAFVAFAFKQLLDTLRIAAK